MAQLDENIPPIYEELPPPDADFLDATADFKTNSFFTEEKGQKRERGDKRSKSQKSWDDESSDDEVEDDIYDFQIPARIPSARSSQAKPAVRLFCLLCDLL